MSDELAIGLTAAGLLASKDILNKLLGPTADYLGEDMRDLVKRSRENIGRILSAACRKLGHAMDQPGQVNPRILKHVVDEGRFIEDELASEYFGGLLASARCADGRDDSLLPKLNLVKSMPTCHLRLHFAIYDLVARLPYGRDTHEHPALWLGLTLTITGQDLLQTMKIKGQSPEHQIHEAVRGLIDTELVEPQYAFHIGEVHESAGEAAPAGGGLVVRPNKKGAGLFLGVLGYRSLTPDLITSVVVDGQISKSVRKAIPKPIRVTHDHVPVVNRVENTLDDVECKVDELKDEIDDLKGRLDEGKTEA